MIKWATQSNLVDIDQYKIIEFNCFNASGFYGHDIQKIVRAVTDYAENEEQI